MQIGYKRGDVVIVNLDPTQGSEQGRIRPCVIVQNDIANKYSPVTNIVPLTNAANVNKWYKCLVFLSKDETGLDVDSAALCNQIRTIDMKNRIIKKTGLIADKNMKEIDEALRIHLGLK